MTWSGAPSTTQTYVVILHDPDPVLGGPATNDVLHWAIFDIPADAIVVHLMGEPSETRSIIVRDGEAVLSPGWSIHAGCGTSAYSFCWAMGGENQDYADMDPVQMSELR